MLSISELTKSRSKQQEYWNGIFDKILLLCHKRIKYCAKKLKSKCFYEVPTCVIGLPVYNYKDCINHLIKKLKNNDLDVEYRAPNVLFISWERHQEDYVKPIKMTTYIPQQFKYNQTSSNKQSYLYANNPSLSSNQPKYFLEENVLQLMPPPKLHYVAPKYPDTLAVSSRPLPTRQAHVPQHFKQIKPKKSKIKQEKDIGNTKQISRNSNKYNFNFI